MKGLVSLVGAGPGDPGLLTLKALERLREADLIIYDYLANPEHLRHAKKEAVKIGVGKGFRHKAMPQAKINRLILDSARQGKRVVRLKGGDPYLFGRGGEEALFLRDHGVAFEVVPGVTSATACAAYAGIPLTHRDHNQSVTFLTGHRADDGRLDAIPWEKIAGIGGTLVIYMGFYNLGKIAKRLVAAGMSARVPVSVIEWGTLARQRSADGTLADIADKVKRRRLEPPCIIIIGGVVALRKKLGWFERLPLFGKKVVLTRAAASCGGRFRAEIQELGGEIVEFPVIGIQPPDSFKEMDAAIERLGWYDWLVFSSAHGVEGFFSRLGDKGLDARAIAGARIASVGAETSRALLRHGIRVDLEPRRFESMAILESLKTKEPSLKGRVFLLLKTDIAPLDLDQRLVKLGAIIHRVTAYKTVMPKTVPAETRRLIRGGGADYVFFTSASTVNNFVKIIGLAALRKIAGKTRFLSIGPVTTKALKSYHLKPYAEAEKSTMSGMVEALRKKA